MNNAGLYIKLQKSMTNSSFNDIVIMKKICASDCFIYRNLKKSIFNMEEFICVIKIHF